MTRNQTGARLARYADPLGINQRWPARPMALTSAEADSDALIHEAVAHNVLPLISRNLETAMRLEPDAVIAGSGEDVVIYRERLLAAARQVHLSLVGRNMVLADIARDILGEAANDGTPVVLVKGLDFAEVCYGGLPMRAFSDIDLLIRPDAAPVVGEMLVDRGFKPVVPIAKREDYTERQFVRDNDTAGTLLVELHTDLAHAPKLRRQTSLTYETYAGSASGGVTMAARLVLAGVHGALSHLFERLQYVTDILAIVRRGVDPAELRERVGETGSLMAVRTGLDLASRIFECPACAELTAALPAARHSHLASYLVTPATVIAAQGPGRALHSWRRQAYRVLMTKQAVVPGS